MGRAHDEVGLFELVDPRKYLMRSPPLRSVHSRFSLRFLFWLMTADAASRMTCVDR